MNPFCMICFDSLDFAIAHLGPKTRSLFAMTRCLECLFKIIRCWLPAFEGEEFINSMASSQGLRFDRIPKQHPTKPPVLLEVLYSSEEKHSDSKPW